MDAPDHHHRDRHHYHYQYRQANVLIPIVIISIIIIIIATATNSTPRKWLTELHVKARGNGVSPFSAKPKIAAAETCVRWPATALVGQARAAMQGKPMRPLECSGPALSLVAMRMLCAAKAGLTLSLSLLVEIISTRRERERVSPAFAAHSIRIATSDRAGPLHSSGLIGFPCIAALAWPTKAVAGHRTHVSAAAIFGFALKGDTPFPRALTWSSVSHFLGVELVAVVAMMIMMLMMTIGISTLAWRYW